MIFDNNSVNKLKKILSGNGKKILIYHRDSDGVSSAAQILRFFSEFKTICREGPILDDKFIKNLIRMNPESITFADIPADQDHEKLFEIRDMIPHVNISIIDHHPFEKDLNSEGIIHINNMLLDDYKNKYIPASCIIWRLLSEMGLNTAQYSWIAGIGIIGDYGANDSQDVISDLKERYPGLVEGDIMKCPLSKGSDMISASITVKGIKGAEYSLENLRKADDFYDFISDPNLQEWHEMLSEEIENIKKDFATGMELHERKKLIFYEIKSEFSISSIIASITSEKYHDHVVITFKKWNDMFKISLRCQDGHIDVGALSKKCSEGIGSGGGHRKAAGGLVNDWNKFRERVIKEIRS